MQYGLLKEMALRELAAGQESGSIYYRGCSAEEADGKAKAFPIWLSDEIEYAKEYHDEISESGGNPALVKYEIDDSRLNIAEDWDFENLIEENGLDSDWDPYDPDGDVLRLAVENGYNCYFIRTNRYGDILALLDESPVISKSRVL